MGRSTDAVRLGVLTTALALAACNTTSSDEGGGSAFRNLFTYGTTTAPPAASAPRIEVECPPVDVAEGKAAMRVGSSQISIAHVARECAGNPDGAVVVKVGIEGRALLGPGGGAARFDAPVHIVLKRGETVLASRARRVAVSVPPGQTQGQFVVVEDGLLVPPGTGEFEIEVGLGASDRSERVARRQRPRG